MYGLPPPPHFPAQYSTRFRHPEPLPAFRPNGTRCPARKREELRIALLAELSELECAFDLLDTAGNPDLEGILQNILYLGMPKEAERVLSGCQSCRRGGKKHAQHTTPQKEGKERDPS